jgi:hypothetical protein
MNIKENNKLLAEFMGCYQNNEGFWGFENTPNHKRWHTDRFLDCTEYDTDWNWLMEIVEKIESLTDINSNGCFMLLESIGFNAKFIFDDGTRILKDSKGETKMEATYNACVEFVQWYNNQNK